MTKFLEYKKYINDLRGQSSLERSYGEDIFPIFVNMGFPAPHHMNANVTHSENGNINFTPITLSEQFSKCGRDLQWSA